MYIFGIGLSKTGTTSLSAALDLLGYRTVHCPTRMMRLCAGKLTFDLSYVQNYDALVEGPISFCYEQLDEIYPESKFILSTRDVNSWARSAAAHFNLGRKLFRGMVHGSAARECLRRAYGSELFDAPRWKQAFEQHNAAAKNYFDARSDFLMFDSHGGDGWPELCAFLGVAEPNVDFPHHKRTGSLQSYVPLERLFHNP